MSVSLTGDTRSNLVAGSLVGAVVLVLGFGSGIGAVFSHHTSYSASGTARMASHPSTGAGDAGAGDPAAADQELSSALAASASPSAMARTVGSSMSTRSLTVTPSSAQSASAGGVTMSPSSSASSGSSAAAGACSNEFVVNAMADPFVTHVSHGHLEESPGQQAGDITNTDQYVKTHTVLIENMEAPGVSAAQASLEGVGPFFTHFNHGHLEESPAQQAADLLDVSQYVKTHTVLIENMAAPATESATGTYGC